MQPREYLVAVLLLDLLPAFGVFQALPFSVIGLIVAFLRARQGGSQRVRQLCCETWRRVRSVKQASICDDCFDLGRGIFRRTQAISVASKDL